MKFEDYHISKAIKQNLTAKGFKRPTDIQFKSIKHILDGEDVMAIAQTGTGKTAAFAIPIIDLIARNKYRNGISALVMVPTRELAKQIGEVFSDLAKGTTVKTFALYGGVDQDKQKKALEKGIDVLITTPGRMFDLISQGSIDVSEVKHLILDEADLMLDLGFSKDIEDILRKIPKKRQTLFFSATISKKIKKMAYNVVRNAIRIQISPKNPVSKNVAHAVAFIEMDDKRFFLENLVKEYPEMKVLVFVRTKVRAERVKDAMKRVGIDSLLMHGGIEQDERFDVIEAFKNGDVRLMITTDVACRGIDIPGVEYVVNYDLPENPENYVHRCGRTGRGTNKGQAISFCSPHEKELLESIEAYTGTDIERYELSKGDYEAIRFDSDERGEDWQSLLDDDNRHFGTEEEW
jgi:ATP-dependent RNA helicase RhlE